MADFVCHGDILYSESIEKLKVFEDSYLVVQDGFVEGIYETLPEKFQGVEVKDYGRGLIIPAFSDLHIHASQFVQRGVGMDKLLLIGLMIIHFRRKPVLHPWITQRMCMIR